MFRKIFFSCAAVLLMLNTAYCSERAMAAYPAALVLTESEPAIAVVEAEESSTLYEDMTMEGLGTAAAVRYYPAIFYKEYFYRENNTQPIRDFRYYGIKTFKPDVERNNKVIRDFRTGLWK